MASVFTIRRDRATRIMTAITVPLLLGMACVLAFTAPVQGIPVGLLLVAIVALAYVFSARSYEIAEGGITVRRPIGSARIHPISSVRRADGRDLGDCMRVWGSGGLFGYAGRFQTPTLGSFTSYAASHDDAVVVTAGEKTFLLSPAEPEKFIAAVREFTPEAGEAAEVPSFASLGWRGKTFAAMAIGLLPALMWSLQALYAPGVTAYTLTSRSLEIHDRFYPVSLDASSIDTAQLRVVDLGRDTEWKPVRRTNGFSTMNYHSGWYKLASGTKVRLYRATGNRVVLLPPRGAGSPVLLETKDPDGFVRQVKNEWGRN